MTSSRLRDERAKQVLETWKKIVEVQMHFNDISMRIRSIFVTILLALFAAIGFLEEKKLNLSMGGVNVYFVTLIPVFGIFGTYLFYFIDRYWYHRLLVGSVKHAIIIETRYKDVLPELSLSDAIGKESPYKPRGLIWLAAKLLVSHPNFKTQGMLHSDGKIELFYKSVMFVLFWLALLLSLTGGVTLDEGTKKSALAYVHKMSQSLHPSRECKCHLCTC
jgi:hypothetical protein